MKALTGFEEPVCISCNKEITYAWWVVYQYCGDCMPAERKERDGKLAPSKRTGRNTGKRTSSHRKFAESLGTEVVVDDWEEFLRIDDEIDPCEDRTKDSLHPVRAPVSVDLTQRTRTRETKAFEEKETTI